MNQLNVYLYRKELSPDSIVGGCLDIWSKVTPENFASVVNLTPGSPKSQSKNWAPVPFEKENVCVGDMLVVKAASDMLSRAIVFRKNLVMYVDGKRAIFEEMERYLSRFQPLPRAPSPLPSISEMISKAYPLLK
ncbi:MAG: hypothetical protein JSS32_07695 [Verrucomicrobia bacterium]|nr:hypothetical protein [Verrucomicrobiota bacterium]